jgi:putative DNA methylase
MGALETWRSRGYIPHFDEPETTQGVTFRLADSLPAVQLEKWRHELRGLPAHKAESRVRARIEAYLDRGAGACHLRHTRVAATVQDALLYFDGERYQMHAWVVMPNHVHVLFTPIDNWRLDRILHSWKSFTAKQANRILGRKGIFWQREYYDRYIRNAKHYDRVVAYIEHNPVEARLCAREQDWPFSSARLRAHV